MTHFPVYSACNLITNKDSEQKIVVHELKELLTEEHLPHKPHRHTFYQVLYIEKGSGTHKIDFKEHPISGPVIYFLSPGQVHDLSITDKNALGCLINFNPDLFSSFLNKSQCIDQLPIFSFNRSVSYYKLPEEQINDYRCIFQKIKTLYQQHTKTSKNLLKVYLLELFYTVLNELNDTEENINITNQKNLIYKFEKLVEENHATEHYPKYYADKLAITANYLNFICKNVSGKTAGEIIRNRIILEAKRLLINSEFSISQISFQLGFEDNSYFTKFFKTNAHISPSEFRIHIYR